MKLAILMDELSSIKPYKDTTVLFIEAAHRLGFACFFFTPNDLCSRDGEAYALMSSIKIKDIHQADWADVTPQGEINLSDMNIILMRKDPPFDLNYITMTYALELAEQKGVLVVNKPQSLRDANEKCFTLNFPQCCSPTLVTKNIETLKAFHQQHHEVIYKPLDGMGGSQVFYVGKDGKNLPVILEVLTENQTRFIMAQRYIPEIQTTGDKRILMVHGEPIPYALSRKPKAGDVRGNLAAGGAGEVVPLTERDLWIAKQVGPTLVAKGLLFVGLDVIGEYLTEINVTSPTCAREISEATGIDIGALFLKGLLPSKL